MEIPSSRPHASTASSMATCVYMDRSIGTIIGTHVVNLRVKNFDTGEPPPSALDSTRHLISKDQHVNGGSGGGNLRWSQRRRRQRRRRHLDSGRGTRQRGTSLGTGRVMGAAGEKEEADSFDRILSHWTRPCSQQTTLNVDGAFGFPLLPILLIATRVTDGPPLPPSSSTS